MYPLLLGIVGEWLQPTFRPHLYTCAELEHPFSYSHCFFNCCDCSFHLSSYCYMLTAPVVQRSLFRFPALADFMRGSGCETGSAEPRDYN
jgi:hypothetical protein